MDALIERVRDVSSSSSEKNNKMRDEASLRRTTMMYGTYRW